MFINSSLRHQVNPHFRHKSKPGIIAKDGFALCEESKTHRKSYFLSRLIRFKTR